jgi:hypothetical protein
MAIHRSIIKNQGNTAVAKHFNQAQHSTEDLQICLLDNSPNTKSNPIRTKEAAWIALLDTVNNGINERDDANQTLHPETIRAIKHFNHSITCWPHLLHNQLHMQQNDLSQYRRIIINAKR